MDSSSGAVQDDGATCYNPTNSFDFDCEDDDTVVVGISFELTSTAAPTDDDADALKTNIADSTGVDESNILDFSLTYTSSGRRRLLATYTWLASFNIVVPLSETSSSSEDAFSSAVKTALTSDSFTSAVQSSTGATVDTSSISVTVIDDGSSSSSSSDDNVAVIGIAFAAAAVVISGLMCVAFMYCRPKKDASSLSAVALTAVPAQLEMVVATAVPTGGGGTTVTTNGYPPAFFSWFENEIGLGDAKIIDILALLCDNIGAQNVNDLCYLDEEDIAKVLSMLPKIKQRKFTDALDALKSQAPKKKTATL